MKQNEKLDLEEALKQFYTEKPLNVDLASSVSDKIFNKQEVTESVTDKWTFYGAITLGISLASLLILYLISLNLNPVLVWLTLPVIGYYWLYTKEYSLLAEKYTQTADT